MSSLNRAMLIGNLGADPELKYTQAGKAVCDLRVATTDRWNDKNGQKQERTEWHRIVVWDKLAENCSKFLTKGRQVFVEGRIQTRKWQDKEGKDRYTTEIQAQTVTFLGSKDGGSRSEREEAPPPSNGSSSPPLSDDDVPF